VRAWRVHGMTVMADKNAKKRSVKKMMASWKDEKKMNFLKVEKPAAVEF
jgi:hypothetical protein